MPPTSVEKSLTSAKLREMSSDDIFANGKAESRHYFGGIRKPPGGEQNRVGLTKLRPNSFIFQLVSFLVGFGLILQFQSVGFGNCVSVLNLLTRFTNRLQTGMSIALVS